MTATTATVGLSVIAQFLNYCRFSIVWRKVPVAVEYIRMPFCFCFTSAADTGHSYASGSKKRSTDASYI